MQGGEQNKIEQKMREKGKLGKHRGDVKKVRGGPEGENPIRVPTDSGWVFGTDPTICAGAGKIMTGVEKVNLPCSVPCRDLALGPPVGTGSRQHNGIMRQAGSHALFVSRVH